MLSAIIKEVALLTKEVGEDLVLQLLQALRSGKNPRQAVEKALNTELVEQSYRP